MSEEVEFDPKKLSELVTRVAATLTHLFPAHMNMKAAIVLYDPSNTENELYVSNGDYKEVKAVIDRSRERNGDVIYTNGNEIVASVGMGKAH